MAEERRGQPASPLGKPGGLYDGVRLTRKGANMLAAASLALLALLFVLALTFGRGGVLVSFDANGGTDVESVRIEYGQPLPEPETPTREGYVFTGWYLDPSCNDPWSGAEPVTDSMTLYAGWEKTT